MAPRTEVLTQRRRRILEAVVEHQRCHGYPPTIREICGRVGLRSPASVKTHIDTLAAAGYVQTDPARPRSIRVCYDPVTGAAAQQRPAVQVPLINADPLADVPLLSAENVTETQPVPADFACDDGAMFMVAVTDEALTAAGILEGDHVVCVTGLEFRDGDFAVVDVDNEPVVRRLRRLDEGRVRIETADPSDAAAEVAIGDLVLHGVVVTVIRAL